MSTPDPKPPEPDPPETDAVSLAGGFDQRKRLKVLALLANGSSRRMAARYVGVAASTITRAGVRDPEYGRQLDEAEQSSEIEILRAIRSAARKPRYWRAGAWLLERKNPDDFAPRPARVFTNEQVGQMMAILAEKIYEEMPEVDWDKFLEKIDEAIESCGEEAKSPRAAPRPPEPSHPPLPDYEKIWAEADRRREESGVGNVRSEVGGPWDDLDEETGSGGFSDHGFSFPDLPILPIPDDHATPPL